MFKNLVQVPVIAQLIVRQLGHITRQQLLAAGLDDDAIQYRMQRGELIPVHAGVYAVGHVPQHAHARSMAAVLACGDGFGHEAALSHRSALALWDLARWPRTMELTASRQVRRPGLIVHRSTTIARRGETRRHHGVLVTSPMRTFEDLAAPRAGIGDERLVRLVNDARRAEQLGPTALQELAARCSRIALLLGDLRERPTRSELEDAFRRFSRRHDLPMPQINAIVAELGGREVDALYPRQRLIVELDGFKYHRDRPTFERDMEKDAAALVLHYATVRITWKQLTRRGAEKAQQIRTILADREPA